SAVSALAPIGSAAAAPAVPPPLSAANAVAPVDGLVIYTEEDARTMADIEQHSRRKGRLRSVMPNARLDVMPATLKLENWNLCALTFDDGPHRTVTRQVLDVLNKEGVRATYFPVGKIAQNYGDLIRDFVAGGHEIGNHSLTHSDLRAMDAEGQRYEIAETNRILRSFGANPVLFRPPYGRYSNEMLNVAREERMGSVLWTVDTRDWKVRDADKIVQHIKTAGGTGNVFLMHSTYPTTALALPRVIAELRAKGCEFVTLSEWLERLQTLALPKIVNAGMPTPSPMPVSATANPTAVVPASVTRN
ncbi:polysaccharide deacetylase family protein, partial [Azospirillum doebereinerae]